MCDPTSLPAANTDVPLYLLCHSNRIPETCILLRGSDGTYWVRWFAFFGPPWQSIRYVFQSRDTAYRWLQMYCFYKVEGGGYYDTFMNDLDVEDQVIVVDMEAEERRLQAWLGEQRKARGWLAPVRSRVIGWFNGL